MIEELYEKYHLELVRWCQGMTGSQQTAEELVQEAFLRAMLNEELLGLLAEKQRRSWLYRTLRNLHIDQLRHTSKETIVDEHPESRKESEEMTAIEWEDLLNSLPDMEGVLFTMRYLQGYNSKQIGEIFAIPPGTVRSKLSSARKHLQDALGGKGYV
ncbi:MAG: RNA polymerase sigma factor [Lachnospiraceae bacterium]|nr:RNA polymerase sigma factor [Lachnospiraceae bacterium]